MMYQIRIKFQIQIKRACKILKFRRSDVGWYAQPLMLLALMLLVLMRLVLMG